MHSRELSRLINDERQREIERRLRLRSGRPPRPPRRSVRQAIGRVLIRIGSELAADGPMPVGRLQSPGQPETQP
jgi:hypothetical protein